MMFNTADIERASDRAFRTDLNAHLDNEATQQRQDELIEAEALQLVQEGQKFYPWTFEHFEEAIGNAPNGDRITVFATMAAATDLDLNNHYSNHMALVAIRRLVEKYWLECARQEAEKN